MPNIGLLKVLVDNNGYMHEFKNWYWYIAKSFFDFEIKCF